MPKAHPLTLAHTWYNQTNDAEQLIAIPDALAGRLEYDDETQEVFIVVDGIEEKIGHVDAQTFNPVPDAYISITLLLETAGALPEEDAAEKAAPNPNDHDELLVMEDLDGPDDGEGDDLTTLGDEDEDDEDDEDEDDGDEDDDGDDGEVKDHGEVAPYVYPEGEDEDEEEVETVSSEVQETLEGILQMEPDDLRRSQMRSMLGELHPYQITALKEALAATWGNDDVVRRALAAPKLHADMVSNSRTLQLRDDALREKFAEYANLLTNVSRLLQNDLSDPVYESLRVDSVLEHGIKQNRHLTTLASAIYEMGDMLGLRDSQPREGNYADLPLDIDMLVKIVATVSYGCNTWATVYDQMRKLKLDYERRLDEKDQALMVARDEAASLSQTLRGMLEEEEARIRDRVLHIRNRAGFYLTIEGDADDSGECRISTTTLRFTEDVGEALIFENEDEARTTLEAFHSFAKRYPIYRAMLNEENIVPASFTITESVEREVK